MVSVNRPTYVPAPAKSRAESPQDNAALEQLSHTSMGQLQDQMLLGVSCSTTLGPDEVSRSPVNNTVGDPAASDSEGVTPAAGSAAVTAAGAPGPSAIHRKSS